MEKVKKKIVISITEEEYEVLKSYADDCDCKPNDIVRAFVSDLTGSDRSNGSDERDYAYNYYERLGWFYFKEE